MHSWPVRWVTHQDGRIVVERTLILPFYVLQKEPWKAHTSGSSTAACTGVQVYWDITNLSTSVYFSYWNQVLLYYIWIQLQVLFTVLCMIFMQHILNVLWSTDMYLITQVYYSSSSILLILVINAHILQV